MGRGWKIALGALAVALAALAVNSFVVEAETKPAGVTVSGGRILHLAAGDVQVLDEGPRHDPRPIVLLHCWTCAIDWWQRMMPLLSRRHRVVAIDLRGYGGSEKPSSGYSMEDQAALVAEALRRLRVRDATVVGHSLGGTVAVALSEVPHSPEARIAIIDQAPDERFSKGVPLTAKMTRWPLIGPAIWQLVPDSEIKKGLEEAFAPGFAVPDAFVADFRRMTYTSYAADGHEGVYSGATPLDRRVARSGLPLLAIFGAQDRIYDARKALAAYAKIPGARTVLVAGAGHSPNVETPVRTARLVLGFADEGPGGAVRARPPRQRVQDGVHNR